MAKYKFKAKKGPQEIIESEIVAESKEEAIEKISQMGYLPVKVERIESIDTAANAVAGFLNPGVSSRRITIFTRQLSILLKSGVPILNALSILATQSDSNYLSAVLIEIHSEIKKGQTLSASLSHYPHLFSPLFVALMRAGEDSGTLDTALTRIAQYRYKQEQIMSTVRTALTYPILMGIVGAGTVIFMLTFVMPKLMKIFIKLGQDLPLPTKILIVTSNFLRQGWVWVLFILIGVAIFFWAKSGFRGKREKLFISSLKLKLPIFGDIILKTELACFSRTLEILLKSGVQLLNAIQISIPTLDNEVIREALRRGYKEIERGESVGVALENSKVFPSFMANLVSVGEKSGRMEEVLTELADTYEAETDEAVKILTNLLEPLMILIMGIVIGGIIISMLLPVFQINMMIQ